MEKRKSKEFVRLSRQSIGFQAIVQGSSAALCFAAAFVFFFQPDAFAAVLVLPRWLWIVPGLLLTALGWTRQRKRLAMGMAGCWVLYTLFFTLEWRSLIHFHSAPMDKNAASVRVIS